MAKEHGMRFAIKGLNVQPTILEAVAGINFPDGSKRQLYINRRKETASYDPKTDTMNIEWTGLYAWDGMKAMEVPEELFTDALEYCGFQLDPEDPNNRPIDPNTASVELF